MTILQRKAKIAKIKERLTARRAALKEEDETELDLPGEFGEEDLEGEEGEFGGEEEGEESHEEEEMIKLDNIESVVQAIADELGVETIDDVNEEMVDEGEITEEEFEMVESLKRKLKVKKIKEAIAKKKAKSAKKSVKESDLAFDEPAEVNTDIDGGLDVNLPNGLTMEDVGQVDLTDEFFEKAKLRAKIRREKLANIRSKIGESEVEAADWPIDTTEVKTVEDAMEDYADQKQAISKNGEPNNTGVTIEESKSQQFVKKMLEKQKLNFSQLVKKGLLG